MDLFKSVFNLLLLVNIIATSGKVLGETVCGQQSLVNIPMNHASSLSKCNYIPGEQAIRGWAASKGSTWLIQNDGKQILIHPKPEKSLWLSFQQSTTRIYVDYIELKWGRNNTQGSDHSINNKFVAGEMTVFFKPERTHSTHSHAFSFLIEQRKFSANRKWNPLISRILQVRRPGQTTSFLAPRRGIRPLLGDSLPGSNHTARYIEQESCRYDRNFHNPDDCKARKLIWTVFPRPIELSNSQLFQLRTFVEFNHKRHEPNLKPFEPHLYTNLCYIKV